MHAEGRDAVIPGVAGLLFYSPLTEVDNIIAGCGARTAEVAVVIYGNTGVAKYADGGDSVAVASQGFAALTSAEAEERTAESIVGIEAGSAPFPSSAMPATARWPLCIGFGIPPTAFWTTRTLTRSAVPAESALGLRCKESRRGLHSCPCAAALRPPQVGASSHFCDVLAVLHNQLPA